MTDQLLSGKTGVVFGVANKRSIAWGVAKAWAQNGADLVLSYQNDRILTNIQKLAEELRNDYGTKVLLAPCDVSSDQEIETFFETVKAHSSEIDMMLHSLAFAPKECLEDEFAQTSRQAFETAINISAYSLVALTRGALPLMSEGAAIVVMTFLGAQKVIPHYNVMGVAKASLEASVRYLAADLGPRGIRINAISAGPMQTLSARGISDFSIMHKFHQEHSPLGRNCKLDELGASALFLASDAASAITGQIIFVDGGYSALGMPELYNGAAQTAGGTS